MDAYRSGVIFLFEVVNDEVVETNKTETTISFNPLRRICKVKHKLYPTCKL